LNKLKNDQKEKKSIYSKLMKENEEKHRKIETMNTEKNRLEQKNKQKNE